VTVLRPSLSTRAAIAVIAAALAVPAAAAGSTSTGVDDGKGVTSRVLFRFDDPRITESSGLETSVRFRNILYTHNDSGDSARFFAVGPHGETRAVYTLRGATNHDWEDMSQGPHRTLWLGDIGNNAARTGIISVYRVREPKRLHSHSVRWTRFDFSYDDGAHNAEALMVDPVTGHLFVVTKSLDDNAIYKGDRPFSTTGVNMLHRVAPVSVTGKVTGADFTSNGKRFVIRTYGQAYFGRRIGGPLNAVPLPSSGESIAFTRNNRNVVISSEGVGTPVYKVFLR
jgi:hypothetical protein